jgi:hypothetical protein
MNYAKQVEQDLLLKEYRTSYWHSFGVIFPEEQLKELIHAKREVKI